MRKLALAITAGLLLAAGAAPAVANGVFAVSGSPEAGWVTYSVQLYYQPLTDGPNLPVKIVPYTMRARSIEAAKEVCAHNLLGLSRYVLSRSVFFYYEVAPGGGRCVTDKSGAIKFATARPVGSK